MKSGFQRLQGNRNDIYEQKVMMLHFDRHITSIRRSRVARGIFLFWALSIFMSYVMSSQ